jgi:multicomponent K+:H+ antiporter subunit A
VFLMARMWPALAGTDAWFYIVATTGLVTMVLGALIALFKDDLKALLAFSTVSHLGLLTMLLGFGTQAAAGRRRLSHHQPPDVQGRAVHDGGDRRPRDAYPRHQALGRAQAPDADHLPHRHGRGAVDGGHPVVQRLPVQGNDAGGGLGHRLVRQPYAVPVLATIGALLSVAYSFRFISHVFLGPARDDYPSNPTIRPSACGPRRRFWWCW